jgi:hypothetical protein
VCAEPVSQIGKVWRVCKALAQAIGRFDRLHCSKAPANRAARNPNCAGMVSAVMSVQLAVTRRDLSRCARSAWPCALTA